MSFAESARHITDPAARAKVVSFAEGACDAVTRRMPDTPLTDDERRSLETSLETLRSSIARLRDGKG